MNKSETSKLGRFQSLLILAVVFVAASIQAQTQDYWKGGAGDFNVATNWSTGTVPASGYAADNDAGSNSIVYINAGDPSWTLNGIRDGLTNSASFVQNGSTITLGQTQSGWLRMGITVAGSVGYYTINSNAILNTPFGITVGEVGNGVLNVNGGTITVNNQFIVNDNGSSGSYGIVNQMGGTILCPTQVWIGQGSGGQNGYYYLSGGTMSCTNWFVLGRSGGTGTMYMTGGILNAGGSGGFFDVGTGFQGNGTGYMYHSGGTVNIVGNGLLAVPETVGGTGTYNLSSNAVLNCNSWICIGRGGPGTLNMSGGMIVKTDTGGDHFDVGAGGSTGSAGTGTINQTGGVITNTTTDFWLGEVADGTWTMSGGTNYLANLIICQGSGLSCAMYVNGGLLSVNSIYSAQYGPSSSTLSLNGGTVQARGNNPNWIYNISSASIAAGGVTFDTQGYAVTIPETLIDAGGGTLTKIGSGTLKLPAANSYAGATVVSNGVLSTTTASSGGGSYTTADGATLDVSVASANGSLPAANMTLGNTAASTLQIDLGTFGNPTVAPISVSGTLTINGTVTVNVTDGQPAVGQFKLISYGSLAGSGTIQLGTLSSGMQATLYNDIASNSIDLIVTSAGSPYWNGNVSSAWDINTTTNWIDLATASPETFRNGEPVVFNDNATGTTTVSLATTVQPGNITVNNSALPYTFTGGGSISGSAGLVKEGTSSLTIANTTPNSYTGPTTIGGGVVSVASLANGGSPSAIGSSSASPTNLLLVGGTLTYTGPSVSINRGYVDDDTNGAVDIDAESNLGLSGQVLVGMGSGFVKGGPAQLTYNGAGSNTLSDVLGYSIAQGPVVMSGTGSGLTNTIVGTVLVGIDNSTNAALTVTTNTTLNLANGSDLIVGDADGTGTPSSGIMNITGGTVTLANSYQVWIGQNLNGVGALNLSGGTFNVNNWLAIGRLNGTGTLTLSSNAVLNIRNAGAFDIGTSAGVNGATGSAVFTQTGGSLSNNCPTWLGEGASGEPAQGIWNMSAGTALLVGNVGQGSPAALMVGQSGIGTNTLNLSGSAAITCYNYVSIGHLSGVNGILNIGNAGQPGGTFAMSGGQDFNVGDSGNGTLNMVAGGGGQLTVPGTMYLTRGGTASGTVNLNGGTILVSFINNGYGFGNNTSNNPQAFNFNGGTLKANTSSAYFIQPYVNTVVQSNGAIIDDGGYTVSIDSVLANGGGGGGLTKLDTGTLYLNGANTYTGTTLVSAGALGVGPSGSIAGPVVVNSGAVLVGDAGTIGTSAINNTLTLNAGSATLMKISTANNDEITGLTGVNYGGSLVLTNISGSPLTPGDVYKLFNCAVPGNGNFSSVTIVPSGSGTFNPANGTLTINSTTPPVMNAPTVVNGNLLITGSGGTAGSGYTILSSTNLNIPLTNWTTNTTGTFYPSGTFTNSIPFTNVPAMFFQLRTP